MKIRRKLLRATEMTVHCGIKQYDSRLFFCAKAKSEQLTKTYG